MIILLIIAIYLVGFFMSLMFLHKFKNELNVNHYDPPHDGYYDDYSSNAVAYLVFSTFWPLLWLIMGISYLCGLLVKMSERIGKKVG